MALHMTLCVNGGAIGHLEAVRLPHRHPPQWDDICHYNWKVRLNGETRSSIDPLPHRFGDGAWVLVARVLDAAGYDVKGEVSEDQYDRDQAERYQEDPRLG